MQKQPRKKPKPKNFNQLELGDQVRYTLDANEGTVERAGKILLMDGSWCVVRLQSKKVVWVSLRCV